MIAPGHSRFPGSYVDVMRSIDMPRLQRLAEEVPGDPTRAVRSMVTASSDGVGCHDLRVWEQAALAQEFALGRQTLDAGEAVEGARRFVAGTGRHGRFKDG